MLRALCTLAMVMLPSFVAFAEDAMPFKVDKHGTGKKAVILVPGLDCGASVWDGAVMALEGDYSLYCLTLAGFDGVAPIKPPYCDSWVAGIAELIQREKLEKPVVVGHSIGGNIALRLAIAHSDLLGGIILVDGAPIYPPLETGETMDSRKAHFKVFLDGIRNGTDEYFQTGMRAYLLGAVTAKADREAIFAVCSKADRETHCGAFYELATTDLRPELPKIQVPVLVLAAAMDQPSPGQTQEAFAGLFQGTPKLELHVIEQSHHFIMYDQPEELNAALKVGLAKMK